MNTIKLIIQLFGFLFLMSCTSDQNLEISTTKTANIEDTLVVNLPVNVLYNTLSSFSNNLLITEFEIIENNAINKSEKMDHNFNIALELKTKTMYCFTTFNQKYICNISP